MTVNAFRRIATMAAAAAAAVIVSVAVGTGAPTVSARELDAQGAVGLSVPGYVGCYYSNGGGRLTVHALAPTVLASDRHAGVGNDWQQVRYRIVWYSAFSGQPTGYSA